MNLKRVKVVKADEGNWYENHIGEVFWVYDALNARGEYTVNNDLGGYYIHKDHCVDVAQDFLNWSRSEFERYVDKGEMSDQDILDLWDAAVAAEAREKKLREAIEEALSWTWDCAEGNMLEVSSILHSSLYPEEGTPQVKPLNNEDMKASQAFINRAMRED